MERVLAVHQEAIRRLLLPRPDLPPEILADTTRIIHNLMDDDRVPIEESFLFPALRREPDSAGAVNLLRAEHREARHFVAMIEPLATSAALRDPIARQELVAALRALEVVYRAHEDRETAFLAPGFRALAGCEILRALGLWVARQRPVVPGGHGDDAITGVLDRTEKSLGLTAAAVDSATPQACS